MTRRLLSLENVLATGNSQAEDTIGGSISSHDGIVLLSFRPRMTLHAPEKQWLVETTC